MVKIKMLDYWITVGNFTAIVNINTFNGYFGQRNLAKYMIKNSSSVMHFSTSVIRSSSLVAHQLFCE